MAKIKTSLISRRYNRVIENLTQKIDNLDIYKNILEQKFKKQKAQQLENQIEKNNLYLLNLEGQTISQKQYIETFSKKDIDKLDQWVYWQKRALNHSKTKKIAKQPQKNDEIEIDFKEKMKSLEVVYEARKSKIINKYTQEEKNPDVIKTNMTFFKAEEERLSLELKKLKLDLEIEYQNKIDNYQLKTQPKHEKFIQKLSLYKNKKEHLKKTSNQYELPEDVILRIDKLRMEFGGLVAVNDLSFDVKEGEIFGLIGPNGAGKTTVFNCITQFYKSSSGQMIYRNKVNDVVNLDQFKVHDVIKHGIVRTFQNVELIWELSIIDNLLVASHTFYKTGFFEHLIHSTRYRREEEILRSKATQILKDLGLLVYKDFYPLGLPYGLLKLVELARTLMTNPRLIILDEPAAGLNDIETKKLSETIRKIQKEYHSTIFLVEHDMGLVMDLCDTVCAISFGKKLAIGTTKEIQANPIVQEAYLGGE